MQSNQIKPPIYGSTGESSKDQPCKQAKTAWGAERVAEEKLGVLGQDLQQVLGRFVVNCNTLMDVVDNGGAMSLSCPS